MVAGCGRGRRSWRPLRAWGAACLAAALASIACSPGALPGSPSPIFVGGGGGRYDGTLTYRRLSGPFTVNEGTQPLSMTLQLTAGDQFTARFVSDEGSEGSLQGALQGTLASGSFSATMLVAVPAVSPDGATVTCEGRGEAAGTFSNTTVTWNTPTIAYSDCAGLVTDGTVSAEATSPIPSAEAPRGTILVTALSGTLLAQQGTCHDGTPGYPFTLELSETAGVAVVLDETVTIEERSAAGAIAVFRAENPVAGVPAGGRRTWVGCGRGAGSYQVFFRGRDAEGHTVRAASPVIAFGSVAVLGTGGLAGRVTSASTGLPIAGAIVSAGGVSAVSDANGDYAIVAVPAGPRLVTTIAAGFATRTDAVVIAAGDLVTFSTALPPDAAGSAITVVLTWAPQATDLDAYLAGPSPGGGTFTVSFADRTPVAYASLDVDATGGPGPETITLAQAGGGFVAGTYRYAVHDFSGAGWPLSQATVTVFQGGGQIAQFVVAAASGSPSAAYWRVFDLTLSASGTVAVAPVQQLAATAPGVVPLRVGLAK